VLAGGLGKGGQGIYVLNVTNPDVSNPDDLLMWEYTDADDADLGYTYSRPGIARMYDGKWYVIFGNGYNNTEADGNVSGTGEAALYIVDLETGVRKKKIVLPKAVATAGEAALQDKPNGLSTPAIVDVDNDGIVDYAYAGDLFGNLWKFNLKDPNPANWDVMKSGGTEVPLFTARLNGGAATADRQAITSRPQVGRGPNGAGRLVLFGTGKYLEEGDRTSAATQTFYGLYDTAGTQILHANLEEQTIIDEHTSSNPETDPWWRATSANAITAGMRGWYMNLLNTGSSPTGEMQITDSVLRSGRIAFSTLVPTTDPCQFGGESWFMVLDAITGMRPDLVTIDLDRNRRFEDADMVSVGGLDMPASGFGTDAIMSQARFVASEVGDIGVINDTANRRTSILINPGANRLGRQSWRQLR
jgi:type IV pilus assembly protein PilY1